MARRALKYLEDVRLAAEDVFDFTAGKSFDNYCASEMLKAAVERKFEVMGEALNQLDELEPGWVRQITDAPKIIGFRNRLIHGYHSIENELVWKTIQTNLPVLMREVEALLKKHG